MGKVIYFCKKCRSTFGGEPNSGRMVCSDCENTLVCTDLSVDVWRQMTDEEKEEKKKEFMNISDNSYKANTDSSGESSIGKTIKTISYIFLVLSIIGSFVLMASGLGFAVGLVALLMSALECCLCVGIGEICNLLNSINNKLK